MTFVEVVMKVAIVGATGLVGRKIISEIDRIGLDIDEFYLFATEKSSGTVIPVNGKSYEVKPLSPAAVNGLKADFALFSAGKDVSRAYAKLFIKNGATVIDNSAAFRMDGDVPLVVPEVNPEDVTACRKLIANPNCSTIQAMLAIKPIEDAFGVERVVYVTFQAVSGAGNGGIEDLKNGFFGIPSKKLPKNIYSDCIPQIDSFSDEGYTLEEWKMINETRKILHRPDMKITATCVRVPVFNCHSESVNLKLKKPFDIKDVAAVLKAAKGVKYYEGDSYPTAADADGQAIVHIGRLRKDFSEENSLNFWCVADNLLKGAATNAVQILELIIKRQNSTK